MFGSKRNPLNKFSKHHSTDSLSNMDNHQTKPSKVSSEPIEITPTLKSNPFEDYDNEERTSSLYDQSHTYSSRNKYKNDFRDSGGFDNQSVQELESYAVYKSEETTKSVNNCLKIAEDIREDATKTLVVLHQQGEQITRTHRTAADIDHDLSRGEKLLGNLGGIFSKTWKPKKGRAITGPMMTRDDSFIKRSSHIEQRDKLGLNDRRPKRQTKSQTPPPEPTNALQKVEFEKAKQDDGLSDLSDLLGELKNMAVDMGSEIERQNKALDPLADDVDELNNRVRGANQRTRRLLGK